MLHELTIILFELIMLFSLSFGFGMVHVSDITVEFSKKSVLTPKLVEVWVKPS